MRLPRGNIYATALVAVILCTVVGVMGALKPRHKGKPILQETCYVWADGHKQCVAKPRDT